MPRLFTGIDLPEALKSDLVQLQPRKEKGLRLVATSQLHITLHFFGECAMQPFVEPLNSIRFSPFTLSLTEPGTFNNSRDSAILWLGIEVSPELKLLHREIREACSGLDVRWEDRPYKPHLTLARYEGPDSRRVSESFLKQKPRVVEPIAVSEFHLYSSTFVNGKPLYRKELTVNGAGR